MMSMVSHRPDEGEHRDEPDGDGHDANRPDFNRPHFDRPQYDRPHADGSFDRVDRPSLDERLDRLAAELEELRRELRRE